MWGKLRRAFRRLVRLMSRPVRRAPSRGGMALQAYRGYGSREEIFLLGRVFRQPAGEAQGNPVQRELIDIGRRLLRRGAPDIEVRARFYGTEVRAVTDRWGYFRVRLRPRRPPPDGRLWHRIELALAEEVAIEAVGEIYIPPPRCRFVVVSDIDDTVVHTGVANTLVMLWRLFVEGAGSRVAFPGVPAFYAGLHRGPGGDAGNPILYVSRAPWGIYEVLQEFFQLHAIPIGPILFLREWDVRMTRPLPRRARDHKIELIRHMLALYRDLPFVLIGDSGQRDPEIYVQLLREHPGRIRAIYIRDVSGDGRRAEAIGALTEEVARAGSSLVLAADSVAMARHAAREGLIPAGCVAEVSRSGAAPLRDASGVTTEPREEKEARPA